MRVIGGNPIVQSRAQRTGAGPFPKPPALCLQGPHDPRGVRGARRGVITGAHVVHAQGAAGPHQPRRRGWAAVITHARATRAAAAGRARPLDGHSQGHELIWCLARPARRLAVEGRGVRSKPHHQGDPAAALNPPGGQVEAPPRVGRGRARLAPQRRPLGLQREVRGDQEGA
jgi:hypothetical protein